LAGILLNPSLVKRARGDFIEIFFKESTSKEKDKKIDSGQAGMTYFWV
jgi:hypothetical protein